MNAGEHYGRQRGSLLTVILECVHRGGCVQTATLCRELQSLHIEREVIESMEGRRER